MPKRPTALQKVYVKELFFFGHSLRICPGEGQKQMRGAAANMCAQRQAPTSTDIVNTVNAQRCTPMHIRRSHATHTWHNTHVPSCLKSIRTHYICIRSPGL